MFVVTYGFQMRLSAWREQQNHVPEICRPPACCVYQVPQPTSMRMASPRAHRAVSVLTVCCVSICKHSVEWQHCVCVCVLEIGLQWAAGPRRGVLVSGSCRFERGRSRPSCVVRRWHRQQTMASGLGHGSTITGRPELDAWVQKWLQDNQVLQSLMTLPIAERQSIVASARKATAEQRIRTGIPAFVTGCIRKSAQRCQGPYPKPMGPVSPKAPMPAQAGESRPMPVGTPKAPSAAGSGARSDGSASGSQNDSQAAADAVLAQWAQCPDLSSLANADATPAWVSQAFAVQTDRAKVCSVVHGALGAEASSGLASLPPVWQHCVAAAATISSASWQDLDAHILAQVSAYLKLKQARDGGPVAAAAPRRSFKVVVFSWGVGLGVSPLAAIAAKRAVAGKHDCDLHVLEIHEFPPDELSARLAGETASRLDCGLWVHEASVQLQDFRPVSLGHPVLNRRFSVKASLSSLPRLF